MRRQNGEFGPDRTRRGRAKIRANERTCDIFPLPLAEGRNSRKWVLAGPIAANACPCQRARPGLEVTANEALDAMAAGNRNPPSI